MPNLAVQVNNLALTVKDALANAVKGGSLAASKEAITYRIGICKTCDRLQGNRCSVCGCYIGSKASINASHCPIKKW